MTDTADLVALGEEEEQVRAALAALPPRQQLVMSLAIAGFSPAEIATELGCQAAAVRQNQAKARRALARQLGIDRRKAPMTGHDNELDRALDTAMNGILAKLDAALDPDAGLADVYARSTCGAPAAPRRDSAGSSRLEDACSQIDHLADRPRELRHSFVSIMSDHGVPIETIADLVGHASTAVTETVYRHQLKPVITRGAETMSTIFTDHA